MTFIPYSAIGVALLVLVAFALGELFALAQKRGFSSGYRTGYQEGRKAADNWWIAADDAIAETRKEMWREH